MIKIQSSSYPIVWQIDNSYLLPAQSGQVRWNGGAKHFEVCDNQSGSWYKINNTVELTADPMHQEIMSWAKKKMEEDKKLEQLIKDYPAVKDTKEKLDIIIKLVQNEDANRTG